MELLNLKIKVMPNKKTPGTKYVMNKHKKDGSLKKHKTISKKRFDRISNRYSKQDGSTTLGTSNSPVQQFVSGRNPNNSVTRVSESDLQRLPSFGPSSSPSFPISPSSPRSLELGGTIGNAPIKKDKMFKGGALRRKYNRGRGV